MTKTTLDKEEGAVIDLKSLLLAAIMVVISD